MLKRIYVKVSLWAFDIYYNYITADFFKQVADGRKHLYGRGPTRDKHDDKIQTSETHGYPDFTDSGVPSNFELHRIRLGREY